MSLKDLYQLFLKHPVISTDTRNISQGSIFFALKGENFNGNTFANDALIKGAAYAIVDEKPATPSEQIILVENVLTTLQNLGNYHRKQLQIPIIGITGTNGKTTTKELVSAVLSQKYKVAFTRGNLNNHIGVPLTLLSMNSSIEIGVVEMGANHIGEIGQLSRIAEPDYGIITNIGKAHLEGFGSFEGVIKAKTELYDFIKEKNRTLFVNIDNAILSSEAEKRKCHIIYYGSEKGHLFKANIIDSDPYLKVNIFLNNDTTESKTIKSQLIGAYNFENILVAITIGLYFKIPIDNIIEAIANYTPSNNRSQLLEKGGNTFILDYYNANPSSVEVAITNFNNLNSKGKAKVIMLGEMLELGNNSEYEHNRTIEHLAQCNFDLVYLVGKAFQNIPDNKNFKLFENSTELKEYLKRNTIENSIILLKGSRGVKMEVVLETF